MVHGSGERVHFKRVFGKRDLHLAEFRFEKISAQRIEESKLNRRRGREMNQRINKLYVLSSIV